ncbi:MAG: hypothetical protein J5695_04790 [Bacteroidales bacterium]|nr:hypothetical protein [Bacteroidales bacterium]
MNGKIIIYQVLPRIWGDGTFASWNDASFGYLKSLGVDCIWFTGIPRHASGKPFVKGNPGSPYAISDWYDVNPYLAARPARRMAEFEALVARTHAAGLKCIMDFIPNHVACDYKGALALYGWHDGDWTDTIKVDWTNPQTPREMTEILRFWASKGIDGFRCDMVELVPAEALGGVISAVRKEFPELMFVAEVYQKENYSRYLDVAGFDLLYDKSGSYDILRGILAGNRSARELTWNWQWLGGRQGNMLNFLENHDEQRLASSWFAGCADKAWAAVAHSLLFNSAPFMLYAGQEVGEDAAEGHEGRTSIFEWCHPAGLQALQSYIATGSGLNRERRHVLKRYRELLALASRPVFASGAVWDLCYCQPAPFDPDRHFAFVRWHSGQAFAVFCNFSNTTVTLNLQFPSELLTASGINKKEATVTAAPFDCSVIKL